MKKILFNDKFSLTQAVLSGRKTQTRRICPDGTPLGNWAETVKKSRYQVGEVVAVAQSYKDCNDGIIEAPNLKGFTDKRCVVADLMPHQIRITNVRVERLQDISDEDCMAEGVEKVAECENLYRVAVHHKSSKFSYLSGKTPREAYAALIDKISGKGTWESNPYVFVYEFQLIK